MSLTILISKGLAINLRCLEFEDSTLGMETRLIAKFVMLIVLIMLLLMMRMTMMNLMMMIIYNQISLSSLLSFSVRLMEEQDLRYSDQG